MLKSLLISIFGALLMVVVTAIANMNIPADVEDYQSALAPYRAIGLIGVLAFIVGLTDFLKAFFKFVRGK